MVQDQCLLVKNSWQHKLPSLIRVHSRLTPTRCLGKTYEKSKEVGDLSLKGRVGVLADSESD
ncbi:MAG: hypothetical protein LBL62_04400 [Planctomycetaceae bacterium]|nr:hypothetical protein [Planctomycetaceae bacterium]